MAPTSHAPKGAQKVDEGAEFCATSGKQESDGNTPFPSVGCNSNLPVSLKPTSFP